MIRCLRKKNYSKCKNKICINDDSKNKTKKQKQRKLNIKLEKKLNLFIK